MNPVPTVRLTAETAEGAESAETTVTGEAVRVAEPRAYADGIAGFRLLDLIVDRRVLIPRPETEGLVELVLAWSARRWGRGNGEWGTVLDLGTGSGCVALSLATEGRFTRIVATDVSADALAVARANAQRVHPEPVPEFRLGHLFEPVVGERFDVIVSNPPYISEPEYLELDPSVRDFEPRQALVSGPDGLAHTRAILEGARHHLAPGGLLALEVDSRRAEQSAGLARVAGFQNVRVEPDVFERPRFLLVRKDRA
ncbi:MAG: protein-(glutamine-N5) methyltransferase, release factor-specific [Gemmatimonadetes bacterium RIFCSPLOWO2_12_FULL_68_9]|nr:MAG: protein-(glutamine-N5) methyltransferase, release factor-specific [Gemmatimonadetes bacterium RIFCSPLOWO2_12_FULL_68_9]